MKRLILLIITIISWNIGQSQVGSTCGNALDVGVLPYSATGMSTCGAGNDYDATDACASFYMDGDDYVFTYTPAANNTINITLSNTDSWTGVFLLDGCPDNVTTGCVALDESSAGNPSIGNTNVTGGTTYYIVVSTYPTPQCTDFDIAINDLTPSCNDGILNQGETFTDCGGPCGACPPPTVQDCEGAIPVCQEIYTESAAYTGTGNFPNEIDENTSCLASGEKNDVWYSFTVQAGGNVCFDIDANDPLDDYDWGVYNLTNNTCADIFFDNSLEVSCNFSPVTGTTGPNGGLSDQEEACIPVAQGDVYVVNVSQFSTSTAGYTLDFTGSTADIIDLSSPEFDGVVTPIACGSTEMTFFFNENIQCGTVDDADFTLSGPGGPYTLSNVDGNNCSTGGFYEDYFTATISPALTTSGTFQLCLVSGSGIIVDACGNTAPPACYDFDIVGVDAAITSSSDPSCGICDGEGTVTASGGTPPYTYNWSSGSSAASATNLCDGTNSVTVYDNAGCSTVETVNLTDGPPPVANAGTNRNICLGSSTLIGANPVGPLGYNYTWSDGQSGVISGSDNGKVNVSPTVTTFYTVSVDAGGCVGTDVMKVDIEIPPEPGTPSNITICASGGNINLSDQLAGEDAGGTWNDDNISGGLTGNSFNPSGLAGTYDFTYTVTGNKCDDESSTVSVTVQSLTADVGNLTNQCLTGNSFSFDGTGSTGGVTTYDWDFDDGNTGSGSTTNHTYASPGTYDVTLTVGNGSCTDTEVISIEVYEQPTVALTTNDPTCNSASDGSITATGSNGIPGYSYTWSGPNSFSGAGSNAGNSDTESNLVAGSYTVTITDGNNCTNTATETLTEPSVLTLSTSSNNPDCNGENTGSVSATLTGGNGGPYTYNWSTFGAGSSHNGTVGAGTYTVTASESTCFETATITLTNPAAITLTSSSADASCSYLNDGVVSSTATGGTPTLNYEWSNGATTPNASSLAAGTYTITVTDGNGCEATSSETIDSPPALSLTLNPTDILCNGGTTGSISSSANGGDAPYTYSWSNSANTPSTTGLAAGNYTLLLTDNSNCTITDNETIAEPAGLTLTPSQTDVSCNGDNSGEASVTVSGGSVPYDYYWNTLESTSTITGLQGGNYAVTVTDNNNCNSVETFTINEPPALTVSTLSCNDVTVPNGSDGSTSAGASGGTAPYDYEWNNGSTSSNISGLPSGTYIVTVTDNTGCEETATCVINEPNCAVALTTTVTDLLCNASALGVIAVEMTGSSSTSFTYLWSDGQTTSSATGLSGGSYTVTVTDGNNCQATQTESVFEPTALAAAINDIQNVSCAGNSDGSINIDITGGTTDYTFSWSNGETTEDISSLTAGNYIASVTDDNGCTTTVTGTVSSPSPITVSSTITDTQCNTSNDGYINTTATGGTSPFSYEWSTGVTSANLTNVGSGNYVLTITDNQGCITITDYDVNSPNAVSVSTNCIDVTTPNGADGSSEIIASGGTAPFTYNWSNSGSTALITGLVSGTYQFTATDANGCEETGSCTINEPGCAVTPAMSVTDISCNGASDGTAIAELTGGASSSFTFVWSSGQTDAFLTGLLAGGYQVTITDGDGCSASATGTINEPNAITVLTTVTDVACFGESTGSITTNVNGGATPLTYNWSNGITAPNAVNITAGNYSLTVTDNNSCTQIENFTVTEPTEIILSNTVTDVTCSGNSDGSINTTISGGTSPFVFNWSNTATTSSISGLAAGNYTLIVTDDNGCSNTTSATITEPLSFTVTTSINDANCGASDGSATLSISAGDSPYTYIWDDPQNSTTISVTGLPAGNYNATITGTSGCTETILSTINNIAGGTSTAITDNNISCNGQSNGAVSVSTIGGTSPYSYIWNNNETTALLSGLASGTYSVTMTDAVGCSSVSSTTVTEPSPFTLAISGNDVSCYGANNGDASVTANGGQTPYNYQWDDINNSTSSSVNGIGADTLYVTITDAFGCTQVDSIKIIEPNEITGIIASVNSSCGSSDGELTVTPSSGFSPYTYVWNDLSAQTTANASGLTSGSYQVTVTDNNGCYIVLTGNVNDNGGPMVTASVISNVSCAGSSDATASASASGGTSPLSYTWSNLSTTQLNTGLAAGNYLITVLDASGCAANATVSVSEPTAATVAVTSVTPVSANGSSDGTAAVAATGGNGGFTYLWDNGTTGNSISGLPEGVYCVTATDILGCSGNTCITITSPDAIVIVANTTPTSCFGQSDGSISASIAGGVSPYTYEWFTSPGNTTVGTTLTVNNVGLGDYYLEVEDANGTTAFSTTVTVSGASSVSITPSQTNTTCAGICDGDASVSVAGGTPPYTFVWSTAETTSNITGLCSGNYTITVSDNNNCAATEVFDILSQPSVTISLTANDLTCSDSNDGSITSSINGGVSPYTYLWTNTQTTSDISGLSAGTYTLSVTDNNNCVSSASTTISSPAPLSVSTSSTSSTCGQSDGTASVVVNQGIAPFTYAWDIPNSQTTATVTGLFAGNYTITVSDANLCSTTITAGVTDAGAPSANILTQQDVTCFGESNGFAQVSVVGGNSPYTYLWDDANAQSTASATGLPAGTWSATMTDGSGCKASVSVIIDEPVALNSIISSQTNVSCFNGTNGDASVLVSGGTSPYNYTWNNGQTNDLTTGLAAGVYTVNVADQNNCTTQLDVSITEPTGIALSTSVTDAVCNTNSGEICLSVSGGNSPYNYNWSDGQSLSCANGLTPGNYSTTITDNNGCSTTITENVGNIAGGTLVMTNVIDASCFGLDDGSATASMSGGNSPYTYLWDNNAIFQSTTTATGLEAGVYDVSVTDQSNCVSVESVTIGEADQLFHSILKTNVSCNGNCDGEIELTISGGNTPYMYTWDDPLQQTTSAAVGLCSGNYNTTISDVNGCTLNLTESISEPNAFNLDSVVTNSNCQQNDGEICLTVLGATPPYNYNWETTETTACISAIASGSYSVTITDNVGCDIEYTAIVSDNAGPTASITTQTNVNCFNDNTGSATVAVSNGSSNYTYEWQDAGQNIVGSVSTLGNVGAGTYAVEITDNSTGCLAASSVTITEPTQVLANQSSTDPSCFGSADGSATVVTTGGISPYSYNWNINPSPNSGNATGLVAGSYTVDVSDANGCTKTLSYTLTDPDDITLSTSKSDISCFELCDGIATVSVTNATGNYNYNWSNGQSSQSAYNLCVGSYTVTVSSPAGCSSQTQVNISQPSELIGFVDNTGSVSCFNGNDGFIQTSAIGGTAPYTYSWSANLTTSSTASALVAGTYFVSISDQNGCEVALSEVISQPTQLGASIINIENATCFDLCNGSAEVSVSGGVQPYFYQWNIAGNGAQQSISNNLCASNNIAVTVTDNNGCTITQSTAITQPNEIIISSTIIESHCGQSDGSITLSTGGGTNPYTYSWDETSFPNSAIVQNISAGCYDVTVLDANGCVEDEVICINDISGPVVSYFSHNDASCFESSDGSLQTSISGGVVPYAELNWYMNGNLFSSGSVGITNLAGNFDYSLEVIDNVGCIGTFSYFIDRPDEIISVITNIQHVECFGGNDGSAIGLPGGGTPPYTYQWNPGSITTQAATGLSAGFYTLEISDMNGCVDPNPATVTINQPDPIILTPTVTNVNCFGESTGSIVYTYTGGTGFLNYAWSSGIPSTNNIAANLPIGTYDVTVSDQNGCEATDQQTLTEPPLLLAFMTGTDATCSEFNGTATIFNETGGVPPYTYSWMNSVNTTNTETGLYVGNYVASVTDANGCSVQLTIHIDNHEAPTINSITQTEPVCNSEFNGSLSADVTGGTAPLTYYWNDIGLQSTPAATGLGSGNYCVTVADANGCVATNCSFLTEPAPFTADAVSSLPSVCSGQTVQVWAAPQGGTLPYPTDGTAIVWGNAGSSLSGYGPHDVNPNPGTMSTYSFTVTDANGCTFDNQVQLFATGALGLDAPQSTPVCLGSSASICFTAEGGTAINDYHFTWLHNNYEDSMKIQSCQSVSPTTDSWYHVLLEDGCSEPKLDSAFVEVYQLPPSQIAAPIREGCPPLEVYFTGTTSSNFPNSTFEWDFNSDGVPDAIDNETPTFVFENSGNYTVSLTVTSADGCKGVQPYPGYVYVYPKPTAHFTLSPDSTTLISPLVAADGSLSEDYETLDWIFEDQEETHNYAGLYPSHTYSDTGSYQIQLTATNDLGCTDTTFKSFAVGPDIAVYAPTAFTPDNDGLNDGFQIYGVGITHLELFIFDRWGERIFEASNQFAVWDGKAKSGKNIAEAGVYVWKAYVTTFGSEEPLEYIGTVTLVR